MRLGAGAVISGVLDGVWSTSLLSRDAFLITSFSAGLRIPSLKLRLEGSARATRLTDKVARLRLARFEPPVHLRGVLGRLNYGNVDARHRFIDASIGLSLELPAVRGRAASRDFAVLRTIGVVEPGLMQIGAGVGIVTTGMLAGALFCCAGPRGSLKEDTTQPKKGVSLTHVSVSGKIGTSGKAEKIPEAVKAKATDPVGEATGTITYVVDLARRAGVFDALEAQLAKEGVALNIEIEIQVENAWQLLGLAAHTDCGPPTKISINISICLDESALRQALAHELVHAKECAYTNAGHAAPYGGHDTDAFKKKVKELEKLVEDQLKKEQSDSDDKYKDLHK